MTIQKRNRLKKHLIDHLALMAGETAYRSFLSDCDCDNGQHEAFAEEEASIAYNDTANALRHHGVPALRAMLGEVRL